MGDIVEKVQKDALRKKYQVRLTRYIDFAMAEVFHFKRTIEFDFYKVNDMNVTTLTKMFEIEDAKKAYVSHGKMYVSDWAMEQKKEILMNIVIHEIIHILYPNYNEEKVVLETKCKFDEIQNSLRWKIFVS